MSPVLGFAWADRSSTLFGNGIWAFSFSRFCIFWLLLIFDDVLHDEGNPAIRRVLRIVRFAKHLISETSDLGDLIWSHSIFLHQASRSVGAIDGQFPVSIITAFGKRPCIGVAFDGNSVGNLSQFLREKAEQFLSIAVGARTADITNRPGFCLHHLDA